MGLQPVHEDSIFGRYLERSCRVLIKKLGKCVATGLFRPRTSIRKGVIELPLLYWTVRMLSSSRTSKLSSLVLLIASPVHEGMVGLNLSQA